MQKSSSPGNSFDETAASQSGKPNTPPLIGDADDVQKTTYVVGKGTDPNAMEPEEGRPSGHTPNGAPPPPGLGRGTDGGER